jgi:hypothetical protein
MIMKSSCLTLLVSLFIFLSCSEDYTSTSLNEAEIFFEETLASISKDDVEENIFYIGTEDGVVYIFNSDNQQLKKISTDFDRIYKVVKDTTDKELVYWVGTRNMGLFRCELKGNSFVRKEKYGRFFIPVAGKSSKYSAYDISVQAAGIYVATSHGLYKVPRMTEENDSTLISLSSESNRKEPDSIRPVVAGNLQGYKDQYLFCACDSGLLRVDLSSDKLEKLTQQGIKNIVIRNDSIFSLVGDAVVVTDHDGKGKKSFSLKLPAQIYYYDETTQINYFISNNSIQLVEDADLYNPDRYKVVHARRPIRTKCHNVMVNDLRHRQSLLVTTHSISRVGHHQDVFNSYGNVKLACADKDYIYYLIDTKIYRQRKDEQKAYPFKDITKAKDIRFMEVLNDELYYVDSNDEIYKASLYSNYFLNSICSWDNHIKQDPNKKKAITAIGKDDKNVYVGVRDGFRNLNEIDKDIPLMDPSTNTSIPDPFITKFVANGDKTLFCTLNDGIFIGNDSTFTRIAGSDTIAFIRDIGIDPLFDNKAYLITNRGFYVQEDSTFRKHRNISAFNRLVVLDSDHIFGVPNFGITNFCDSMDYFVDIQFNPMACLSDGNKLIAGSSNGVYVFSSDLSKDVENRMVGTTRTYYRINFVEKDYFSRTNILFCIIIIIAILIGLWWYDRYSMSRRTIQTYKDGLVLRLDELNSVREHLNSDTTAEIDRLLSEVESIDVSGKKEAISKLRNLSLRIMELTGRVPALLMQILQDQIVHIKKSGLSEATNYIEKTNEAIQTHTLLRLGGQIKQNSQWLSEVQLILDKLSDYNALFASLPGITGVTDEIKKIIKSALSPKEKIIAIEEMMEKFNDSSSKGKIKAYLEGKIELCNAAQRELDEKAKLYSILQQIQEDYHKLIDSVASDEDMTEVMKLIPAIDRQQFIILSLCTIHKLLLEYQSSRDNYEKIKKEIDKKAYVLSMDESQKEKDLAAREQWKDRRNLVSADIIKRIDSLYEVLFRGPEKNLLSALEINQKESQGQFMDAYLLALLMAKTEIPVSQFDSLLGRNEQSIRRVHRALKTQINSHREELAGYSENHVSSIASLLILLIDE